MSCVRGDKLLNRALPSLYQLLKFFACATISHRVK